LHESIPERKRFGGAGGGRHTPSRYIEELICIGIVDQEETENNSTIQRCCLLFTHIIANCLCGKSSNSVTQNTDNLRDDLLFPFKIIAAPLVRLVPFNWQRRQFTCNRRRSREDHICDRSPAVQAAQTDGGGVVGGAGDVSRYGLQQRIPLRHRSPGIVEHLEPVVPTDPYETGPYRRASHQLVRPDPAPVRKVRESSTEERGEC
jgi:hypothetical protein